MARVHPTDSQNLTDGASYSSWVSINGGYLTDGETLFHLERTLAQDVRGDLLVELENCATLELIVCSGRSVAELGLRAVQPLMPIAN